MIRFNGHNHNDVVFNGIHHSACYLNGQCVWRKVNDTPVVTNLFDPTVADMAAYIRYANHVFKSSDITSNRVAVFHCQPNTTYTVTLAMDSRFRLSAHNGVPAYETVCTNYIYHSLDVNDSTSQNGTTQSLQITTGATDTVIIIGYWSSAGSLAYSTVRDSITITAN